jgi:hypothetical protein
VEVGGEIIHGYDKLVVCSERTILWRVSDEQDTEKVCPHVRPRRYALVGCARHRCAVFEELATSRSGPLLGMRLMRRDADGSAAGAAARDAAWDADCS